MLTDLHNSSKVYESDSVLLKLPQSCSDLSVGGYELDNAVVSVVTQLSKLTSLKFSLCSGSDDCVRQLSALRGLKKLSFVACSLSEAVVAEVGGKVSRSQKSHGPDWL